MSDQSKQNRTWGSTLEESLPSWVTWTSWWTSVGLCDRKTRKEVTQQYLKFLPTLETAILHVALPKQLKSKYSSRDFPGVQWLRIRLPKQGTWVQSLVQENPTCHGATKPMHHSYWSPSALEPVLHDKRSHRSEKPAHHNERATPARRNQRTPAHSNEGQAQTKIK